MTARLVFLPSCRPVAGQPPAGRPPVALGRRCARRRRASTSSFSACESGSEGRQRTQTFPQGHATVNGMRITSRITPCRMQRRVGSACRRAGRSSAGRRRRVSTNTSSACESVSEGRGRTQTFPQGHDMVNGMRITRRITPWRIFSRAPAWYVSLTTYCPMCLDRRAEEGIVLIQELLSGTNQAAGERSSPLRDVLMAGGSRFARRASLVPLRRRQPERRRGRVFRRGRPHGVCLRRHPEAGYEEQRRPVIPHAVLVARLRRGADRRESVAAAKLTAGVDNRTVVRRPTHV